VPDVSFDRLADLAATVLARHGHYWLKFTCRVCDLRQDVDDTDKLLDTAPCGRCGTVHNFRLHGGAMKAAFLLGGSPPPIV
jgi:transcription elongation factor Elf1